MTQIEKNLVIALVALLVKIAQHANSGLHRQRVTVRKRCCKWQVQRILDQVVSEPAPSGGHLYKADRTQGLLANVVAEQVYLAPQQDIPEAIATELATPLRLLTASVL